MGFKPDSDSDHPLCIQGQLREAIRDMVLRCPQTLFIFDEAEKLHPGLIDAIKPYMDHYDNVDGVSYRRAIFLFLRLVYTSGTSCLMKLGQKILYHSEFIAPLAAHL